MLFAGLEFLETTVFHDLFQENGLLHLIFGAYLQGQLQYIHLRHEAGVIEPKWNCS